jgi:hypothetical protein
VHEAREARRVFAVLREELRERVEAAREAYGAVRGEGQDRVSAGLAAMRAALEKQREAPEAGEGVGDRLRRMLERDQEQGSGPGGPDQSNARARLDAALVRAQEQKSGPERSKQPEEQDHVGRASQPRRAPERPGAAARHRGRDRDDGYER